MGFFTSPSSYRINAIRSSDTFSFVPAPIYPRFAQQVIANNNEEANLSHLILLICEAVLEVVCVSLPGYIVARKGLLNADHQKFLANLNISLFSPCLIFTKLASQLNAEKLLDLAIIPLVFVLQTIVSYLVSIAVAKCFGFGKRPSNFVTAMGVFGNSNSLPISLVISLSQTIKGLHWDKIPGDNDDEVSARGILYLLVFQQLGQVVRWSWGYHVLLAPPEKYVDDVEQGSIVERYTDNPELLPGLEDQIEHLHNHKRGSSSTTSIRSDNKSIITDAVCVCSGDSEDESSKLSDNRPELLNEGSLAGMRNTTDITSFPRICASSSSERELIPSGLKGFIARIRVNFQTSIQSVNNVLNRSCTSIYSSLPVFSQKILYTIYSFGGRFLTGFWEFMNPPLWAMLFAVLVASIPRLQYIFFAEGSFIANSLTRAITQTGGVAVPLILVVLGANLARNTLPPESLDLNSEENQIGTKLLIASLISRMLLPVLIMAPILALIAKYVPVSIVDDPIFVIVCFLIIGAPSALQLAQICQINGVYEGVMCKLLFQSYVIWILPSTLVIVTAALEVLKWAKPSS